jgi:hypothetical protein
MFPQGEFIEAFCSFNKHHQEHENIYKWNEKEDIPPQGPSGDLQPIINVNERDERHVTRFTRFFKYFPQSYESKCCEGNGEDQIDIHLVNLFLNETFLQ